MLKMTRRTPNTWLLSAMLSAGLSVAGPARALPAPTGRVVLTVKGRIGATNRGATAVFDMAMLEALPQASFTTMTPWDQAPVKFSGPLLRDVLAAVKVQGSVLRATALNDYKITIPVEDTRRFDVLLAHHMDNQPIPIRNRGPLLIVYPFDSKPALQDATYYERSIWQLDSLDIE